MTNKQTKTKKKKKKKNIQLHLICELHAYVHTLSFENEKHKTTFTLKISEPHV